MQSLANVSLLNLTYWNPTKTVYQVLGQIKAILSEHADLDVSSERNDRLNYPSGAYHPIEDHLIKLALVFVAYYFWHYYYYLLQNHTLFNWF